MDSERYTLDIIARKRDSKALSSDDIDWFVKGVVNGEIPDYMTSALLMAIFLNDMDVEETFALTKSMIESGEKLNLRISRQKFDKHSTGGVGDKVSLLLAPLISSCGIAVPMLSGRTLGHTGGTLNKLESIPKMQVYLSNEEIEKGIRDIGMVIAGQTERIAPADKKFYSLRDKTGTVGSIPLITSSILSKKLSEDIDGLVMDIKVGKGAFMKTRDNALRLAESIMDVARRMGIKINSLLTNMNIPLGKAVGSGVEVYEAIRVLRGEEYPSDLMDVTLTLSQAIVDLAGLKDIKLVEKIRDGSALKKFKEFVEFQRGDVSYIDIPEKLLEDCTREDILANRGAYIVDMDTEGIGRIAVTTEELSEGIIFQKKVGDWIEKGDILASIYWKEDVCGDLKNKDKIRERIKIVKESILSAFKFGREPLPKEHMIIEKL